MDWTHELQKQYELPGTYISLVSEQGSGKSMFWKAVSRMIDDQWCAVVREVKDIAGNFNSTIERKLFICCEEATDTMSLAEMQKMKCLVTEGMQSINEKCVAQRQVKNVLRLALNSNYGIKVHVG